MLHNECSYIKSIFVALILAVYRNTRCTFAEKIINFLFLRIYNK